MTNFNFLPDLQRSIELIQTCYDLDALPYEGKASWVKVSEVLDWPVKPNSYRSFYRRMVASLNDNGYTVKDFADWVLDHYDYTELDGMLDDYNHEFELEDDDTDDDLSAQIKAHERNGLKVKSVWESKPGVYQFSFEKMSKAEFNEDDADYLVQRIQSRKFLTPYIVKNFVPEKRILAMPNLYDEHLGKLSFTRPDEDIVGLHQKVFHNMVNKAENNGATDYLYVVGNDSTNIDNVHYQTTKGTPQNNKVTWQTEIDMFVDLKIANIDYLLSLGKKVTVIIVRGNHNDLVSYVFGKTAEIVYRDNPNVVFVNGHNSRKYYRWGNNGFMFIHGSDEKKKANLPNLMAIEAPRVIQDWYKAKYFEVHTGHLHKRSNQYFFLDEDMGVIQRFMPSLSTDDNWHVASGYVGNNRGGMLLMYDYDGGSILEAPSIIQDWE